MALAVLGDDAEAGEGAPLAGDVEGRVPAVVGQPRVTAGLQELLDQLGLLRDHCQVEGSLGGEAFTKLYLMIVLTWKKANMVRDEEGKGLH